MGYDALKDACRLPPGVLEEDIELVKRTIKYLGPCPKCGGQRLPMISDVPKNRCMKCGAIERTKDKRCHRRTAEG
jgi:hypothetical protein